MTDTSRPRTGRAQNLQKFAVVGALTGGLALGLFTAPALADDPVLHSVSSPDGALTFEIRNENGQAHYRVLKDGKDVIGTSRLGLRFEKARNLDHDLELTEVSRASRDETWEQPWGERRLVRDHHNELVADFRQAGKSGGAFAIRARVFDDGVAFRYEVKPDKSFPRRRITDEITEFRMDANATSWWIPGGEWNRYEYLYTEGPVGEIVNVHTPVTMRLADGPHVSIHEAALVDYSGMRLIKGRPGTLIADLAPAPDGTKVHTKGGFRTPWRTIQVADEAVGLINSDLILNLNEPNTLGDVSWVEPGKYVGIWWGMHIRTFTWGSGPIHGATTENTRRYIDFAAEHGFDGVLVEGWNIGWDGDWFNNGALFNFTQPYPDFDMAELSRYGAEKGVRIIGHHETSGDLTNYESQLSDALDYYQTHGVRSIKTGYVADGGDLVRKDEDGFVRNEWHDGQYAVNHHIRVLEEAAKRKITINAHEPVKDTGLRRTYPNAISREGARGQEYNAWGVPANAPDHIANLAFTRMLSGPMDFTPGTFDLEFGKGLDSDTRVKTTLAKQLALYVVLYAPLQMASDLPKNYEARPEAFQFIKDVAVDWEQSIALQGEVGEFVVIARQERGGEEWFLGAVTDEAARDLTVDLGFLDEGRTYEVEAYLDGEGADWKTNPYAMNIFSATVKGGETFELPLAPGGGAALRFIPKE